MKKTTLSEDYYLFSLFFQELVTGLNRTVTWSESACSPPFIDAQDRPLVVLVGFCNEFAFTCTVYYTSAFGQQLQQRTIPNQTLSTQTHTWGRPRQKHSLGQSYWHRGPEGLTLQSLDGLSLAQCPHNTYIHIYRYPSHAQIRKRDRGINSELILKKY